MMKRRSRIRLARTSTGSSVGAAPPARASTGTGDEERDQDPAG